MFIIGSMFAIVMYFWWVILAVAVFYYVRKNVTLIVPRKVTKKNGLGEFYETVVYERGWNTNMARSFYILWVIRITKPLIWLKVIFGGKSTEETSEETESQTEDKPLSFIGHVKVIFKQVTHRCENSIKQQRKDQSQDDLPKAKKFRSGDFM